MESHIPYEQRRNPNLPWGYWCTVDPDHDPHLIDDSGRRWDSLRHYLWCGRLGMARGAAYELENQTELLLSALAAIDRRTCYIEEQVIDLFKGSWDLARHYGSWLKGHRVADGLTGGITHEGHAMLVTLASTRSAGAAPVPIGLPTIAPARGLDHGSTRAERERVFKANETFALGLPGRFVREVITERPGIKLVGVPEGENVPLGRVLWTMTFGDDFARDRMFAWLIHRLDRWPAWTERARREGAQGLSDHFLQLRFADELMEPA